MNKGTTRARPLPAILRTLQEAACARVQVLRNTESWDSLLKRGAEYPKRSLGSALRAEKPAIIAEVKKASPSKGVFRKDFEPLALARAYHEGGAAAISVVTEPDHFQGSGDWIASIRGVVDLPILRKDFIVDELQVAQSAALGADAILLIARILTSEQLKWLGMAAAEAGLEIVHEAHDSEDLQKLADVNSQIVGINARDLDTFTVDIERFDMLRDHIAPEALPVAESGLYSRDQIAQLVETGYQGFLIGESLIVSPDPAAFIKHLRGAE